MAEPGSNKAAGWYPSSRTPGMERYWNGDFWTSDYRPDPNVQVSEAPEAPPQNNLNSPAVEQDVWSALHNSPASQQPILAPGVRTEFSRTPQAPPPSGYGQLPPNYQQSAVYGANGQQFPYAPVPQHAQGLSLTALILSFFVPIAGLAVGIAAYVKSKNLGRPNGMSLAAIIVSGIFLVISLVFWIPFTVALMSNLSQVDSISSDYGDSSEYGYDDEFISVYSAEYAAGEKLETLYPVDGDWSVNCDPAVNFELNQQQLCTATLWPNSSEYYSQEYEAMVTVIEGGNDYDPNVSVVLQREFEGLLKDPGLIVNE